MSGKLNHNFTNFKKYFKLNVPMKGKTILRFKENMVRSKKIRGAFFFIFAGFISITFFIRSERNFFKSQIFLKNKFLDLDEWLSRIRVDKVTDKKGFSKLTESLYSRAETITKQDIKTPEELIIEIRKINNTLEEYKSTVLNIDKKIVVDYLQIVGLYIDHITKEIKCNKVLISKEFHKEISRFLILFEKNYKLDLNKENLLFDQYFMKYFSNSLVVLVNIYKVLLNFSEEDTLIIDVTTRLIRLAKKTETIHFASSFANKEDMSLIISLIKRITKDNEDLTKIILEILIQICSEKPEVALELITLNFFSNFIVNKLKQSNTAEFNEILNVTYDSFNNHKGNVETEKLDKMNVEIERFGVILEKMVIDENTMNNIKKFKSQL